jgi:serine/threonine protein phosphatase PrpC
MIDGGESKNQDRARWYGRGQEGLVCDGVSSSPEAAKAAELAATFLPNLFMGNIKDNLESLCNILMANRNECYESDNITLPSDTPPAMRDMLKKVVKEKRSISYQTTMIAIKLVPDGGNIIAHIIKCGDSAYFAFSPDGQLLTSSLEFASQKFHKKNAEASQNISFGPGDEILVRIEHELGRNKALLRQSSIRPEHAANWLVCSAIDSCGVKQEEGTSNLLDLKAMSLNPGDLLLVPKYLYGAQLTSEKRKYLVLRYSSTIKPIPFAPITRLASIGSTTMVLPDHFYTGCYDSFQDSFPKGTSFILCSDGFYNAFSDWKELWEWLQKNKAALNDKANSAAVIENLHTTLKSRGGDDDISFIWAMPKKE